MTAVVSPAAHAAEAPDDRDHALPCRPTIACTADIVAPGTFEIEAGGLFRKANNTDSRQLTFPVLLKQTLTKRVQLQVGTNGYSDLEGSIRSRYLDNVVVGAKLHLVDQTAYVPSFSISGAASLPTFRETGYLRTYDALFTAYATKDLGPLHADLNGGLNFWRLDGDVKPQAWTALALSMSFVAPFGGMIEGYAFSDAEPVTTRDGGFLFALSLTPRPWLVFDVGADVGFYPTARSYSTFLGMTIVPVVLWRDGSTGG